MRRDLLQKDLKIKQGDQASKETKYIKKKKQNFASS